MSKRFTLREWALVILLTLVMLSSAAAAAAPVADEPAVAVVKTGATFVPVSITGSGFGLPDAGSAVVVTDSGLTIGSTDARIAVWNDKQVVVKLDPSVVGAVLRVQTQQGQTAAVPAVYYRYQAFSTIAGGWPGAPFDVAVDAQGRAWVLEEFQQELKYWSPTDQVVHSIAIPHGPGPGGFANNLFGGDTRMWNSQNGEDIDIDDQGRIWFAQGGGAAYQGQNPNHSRIVSYDPATSTFRIWNVPGDRNEVTHVSWDRTRRRLWFTEARREVCNVSGSQRVCSQVHPTRLVAFYPDDNGGALPPSNTFDFDTAAAAVQCNGFVQNTYPTAPTTGVCSNLAGLKCVTSHDCVLATRFCAGLAADDPSCFSRYPISNASSVTKLGQIAVENPPNLPAVVWYASYLSGGEIGRLNIYNPFASTSYPLPPAWTPLADPTLLQYGTRPWDLKVHPQGGILLTEKGAGRVSRLKLGLSLAGDYTQLEVPNACDRNATGHCIVNQPSPDPVLDKAPMGVAVDPNGRIWFSEFGATQGVPTTTLGMIEPGFVRVLLLPPMTLLTGNPPSAITGLDVDARSGDVWFTDYLRKEVGRLKKIPVAYPPSVALQRSAASFIPVSITGTGFGQPCSTGQPCGGSQVKVKRGTQTLTYNANAPEIVSWNDRQVVVNLTTSTKVLNWAQVLTPGGQSAQVPVETYQYDAFDAGHGATNDLVADAAGRVFVVGEYEDQQLNYYDPSLSPPMVVKDIDYPACNAQFPQCADPPFLLLPTDYCHFPCLTWSNQSGEDNVIDDHGRIWFAQCGYDPAPGYPNHARVGFYDPATDEFRFFNVPGNQNHVSHLAWDPYWQRLWFTQDPYDVCNGASPQSCVRLRDAQAIGFFPDDSSPWIVPDNFFDFVGEAENAAVLHTRCLGGVQNTDPNPPTVGYCENNVDAPCVTDHDCVLAHQLCHPGGGFDFLCYHAYAVGEPNMSLIGHVAVDSQSRVWVASYFPIGLSIDRIDPPTAAVTRYPLHGMDILRPQIFNIPTPWELRILPDALGGDVIVGEFTGGRIAELDGSRIEDPACQHLTSPSVDCDADPTDTTCANPCIRQRVVPNYCDTDGTGLCIGGVPSPMLDKGIKGVAVDAGGTIWIGEHGTAQTTPVPTTSVGMIRPPGGRIVIFPPLQLYGGALAAPLGIDVSPATGEIFFADFFRHELGRLRRIH